MFEERIKEEIQSAASVCFGEYVKISDINVEKPADRKFGDFSSNISFQLAAKLKKSPNEISEKLTESINDTKSFEKVESISGFINFTLPRERYSKILSEILKKESEYAKSNLLKDKKIQVEFISANPTGPLTLANGRGGFSGDALSNTLAMCGAKVEREFYVNDGGNQVKILGESILVSAGFLKESENIYRGEYIDDWSKSHESEIKKNQEDPFALGQLAAKEVLEKHIKPSVKKMKVDFDVWFSEDKMIKSGLVEKVLSDLNKYQIMKEEDGAKWFCATKFGENQDYVLIKSDGERTYLANDIAYLFDKLYNRKFDKVIDIWGADHHGHVGRMLAAEKAIGCENHLEIVITQMVRLIKGGKEYKMSKRQGTYVTMDDLFDLIGSNVEEASDVARFFFLSRSFNTHMDFDLDLAKERSEKNPVFYVKYAFARIHGILAKSGHNLSSPANQKPDKLIGDLKNIKIDSRLRGNDKTGVDLSLLTEEAELQLIDKLSELPALVQMIATSNDYPVHLLTSYAIDVAKKFHYFYDKCRVIDEKKPELSMARLELVRGTKIILGIVGRDLIGIEMPEKM